MVSRSNLVATPEQPQLPGEPADGRVEPPSEGVSNDPRRRRTWILTAGVVAVAVVVAVAAFALLYPTKSNGPAGPAPTGPPVPSSSALTLANATVLAVPGGPWTLRTAFGMDILGGIANTTETETPMCRESRLAESAVPYFSGNYSNGSLSTWFFTYDNPAGNSTIEVEATGGAAHITVEYRDCLLGPGGSLPSSFVSSTTAARAAWGSSNITNYIRVEGSSDSEFYLNPAAIVGYGLPLTPAWELRFSQTSYSYPPLIAASGCPVASALVNATIPAGLAEPPAAWRYTPDTEETATI